MFHNTNISHPNQTFHTQIHTRNAMQIRTIDSYTCGIILENTMNVAQEYMQSMNCHTKMGNMSLSFSLRLHYRWHIRVFRPCQDTPTHVINMSLKEISNRCTPKVKVIHVNSFMTSLVRFISILHFQTHMHMVYFRIPLEIPIPQEQVLLTFFATHTHTMTYYFHIYLQASCSC